jgi:hypothetical protein
MPIPGRADTNVATTTGFGVDWPQSCVRVHAGQRARILERGRRRNRQPACPHFRVFFLPCPSPAILPALFSRSQAPPPPVPSMPPWPWSGRPAACRCRRVAASLLLLPPGRPGRYPRRPTAAALEAAAPRVTSRLTRPTRRRRSSSSSQRRRRRPPGRRPPRPDRRLRQHRRPPVFLMPLAVATGPLRPAQPARLRPLARGCPPRPSQPGEARRPSGRRPGRLRRRLLQPLLHPRSSRRWRRPGRPRPRHSTTRRAGRCWACHPLGRPPRRWRRCGTACWPGASR